MKHFITTETQSWQSFETQAVSPNTTLALDGTTHQEWEGFGGCFNELSKIAINTLSDEEQKEVYHNLFGRDGDGLKFDFCRIPIGASDYGEIWYSHNEVEGDYEMKHFSIDRDKKYLLPYIKEALKLNPDMRFFASPWSPPTWMKTPKAYNFGTLTWTEENLNAYALYLLKFVQSYEAEGIHIDQIHVQNEPTSSQKFPSCIWTGEEFAEFIGKYLGPLFEKNNITTKIWLGTLNGPETDFRSPYTRYNNYANLVLHDEEAYKYIEGVSYQWAGKYAIQITKNAYPEKKFMQSENECGNGENTWTYAKYIFEMFHHYISNDVCAYIYWNMALAPHGASTWGWKQNTMITIDGGIHYNYEYYVMKHFARYIRVGAKRLGLSGHLNGNAVAFQNPDNSVVLVVINPLDKVLSFEFKGEVLTLASDSINTFVFEA